jgi:hypothetical protein
MALTQATIDRLTHGFKDDLARAKDLSVRIALNGASRINADTNGASRINADTYGSLSQPDRRDAAQFIFFEAAALFESFCVESFKIEVRRKFDIQPQRATFIMDGVDRGLTGVMGWASPSKMQERARNLFGKVGFFARLEDRLGSTTYLRLTQAHKVRNRIAHAGGNAASEFNNISLN